MESQNQFQRIRIDLIDAPRVAMRTTIDDEQIDELEADIAVHGLIEPIVVRPVDGRYELIAGQRRLRAARLLGWELIEAKVIQCDDDTAFALRLAENLQRRDVSVVDEASYIGEIMLRTKKSISATAEMLHRSVSWVNDRLAVFEMPDYLKDHLHYGRVSLGAAMWLVQIENENQRRYYSHYAAQNGCTVMQARRWVELEQAIKKAGGGGLPSSPNDVPPPERKQIFDVCAQCGEKVPVELLEVVSVHKGQCPTLGHAPIPAWQESKG